jgi:hypothetical protein
MVLLRRGVRAASGGNDVRGLDSGGGARRPHSGEGKSSHTEFGGK